jgi:hypothetical protein
LLVRELNLKFLDIWRMDITIPKRICYETRSQQTKMYIYFTQDRITPISINKPHAPLREPASPLVHLALRARLHRLPRHARAQPPHGSRAYDGKEGEDKCGSSASTSWRIRPRNRQYVQKDVDVASWNPCCRRPSPLLVH